MTPLDLRLSFRATLKAAEAAMTSRQWKKAVQILKVINGQEHLVNKCYKNIAEHYKEAKDYKVLFSLQIFNKDYKILFSLQIFNIFDNSQTILHVKPNLIYLST